MRPGSTQSTPAGPAPAGTVAPEELIGTRLGPHDVLVETGALRFFARAVGSDDPVHHDPGAAAAAGLRGLLAPPTYLFSLERAHPEVPRILRRLGIDVASVLHGEQAFRYHAPVYAGDLLTFRPHLSDHYVRKGGALEFLVRDCHVTRGDEPVADLRNVLVVRR